MDEMATFDSYDNYYVRAMEAYCSSEKIDPKDINDEERESVIKRACIHMGFYLNML